MSYHISRDGNKIGVFTEEEVLEGLEKRVILPTDELWTEGMEDWQPVREVVEADNDEAAEVLEAAKEPEPEPEPEAQPEPEPEPKVKDEAPEAATEILTGRGHGETKLFQRAELDAEPAEEWVKPTPAPPEEPPSPAPPATPVQPVASAAVPAVVYVPLANSVVPGQYGTEGTALASMVLSILSLVTGFITGLPAVFCGHLARSRIRRSGGAYSGYGLAAAGLIIGYLTSIVSLGWLGLLLVGVPVPPSQTIRAFRAEFQVRSEGRELGQALKKYATAHKNQFPATLDLLVEDKILDAARLKQLQRTDFGPGWKGEPGWQYMGKDMPDTESSERPLLLSNATDASGRHVVIYHDATADKAEVVVSK